MILEWVGKKCIQQGKLPALKKKTRLGEYRVSNAPQKGESFSQYFGGQTRAFLLFLLKKMECPDFGMSVPVL